MTKEEYEGAIEVSVIFHEGQRMFAVPKQPAQQEPVAKYMGKTYRCPIVNLYQDIPVGTLLYTTPAQRKPLTEEEQS